ncbi:hypothetical protein V6x_13740 [Gimesia chilikensis]|uniref:Uncharacterized protein n=1 Tax=Gimesia chilikensis TaxID=2605989 RepID=A0A517W8V5_9PLAN|nr:hypothetical protein [Gimesia chilikensis]QDU01692.1 hypothetical protein V6x_13740 [Gimesia chilikensis]
MSQNQSEVDSANDEGPVYGFLDCVAFLMAKRWLKDQRSQDENIQREGNLSK